MARRKSAEELMLEAEIAHGNAVAGARQAAKEARDAAGAHIDAPLPPEPAKPGAGAVARARRLANPRVILAAIAALAVAGAAAFLVYQHWFSNSTDIWDGTADTSWYSEGMTRMNVTTAEQLAGIRELCNAGESMQGIAFRLARNLDLYEIPTKPIGDGRNDQGSYHIFKGSFDGGDHTISGLNVVEDTWDHAGLFGQVSDGDISNLTVEGKVTGQVRVGGIVGEMSGGSLTNCTNRCKVSSLKTATSYYPVSADVGGVCGIWLGITWNEGVRPKVSYLVNEGDVSARACSAGGVVGTIANGDGVELTVNELRNEGSVTVYCESDDRDEAVGGVVGVIGSYGTDLVSNLQNNGEVSCSSVLSVGGVVGALMPPQRTAAEEPAGSYTQGVELRKLANTARIAANSRDERAHVGGIVGYLDDPDVNFEDCQNSGELAATNGNADDICATDGAEVWNEWEDEHPATYA